MSTNPLKSTSVQSSYEGAYDLTYSFNEYWFGLYPAHEGITLPPGEYDLEIEVTGGITFSAAGAQAVGLPSGAMYIGPGGVPQPPPPYRYSAGGDRLFQVNVVREHLNNGRRVRRVIWTAPFMEPVRAGGKVRVQGGARFLFTRYSPASWPLWYQDAIGLLLAQGYQPSELWVSNQTGRLVAKPVAELALECAGNLGPGRVTRGESVRCSATAGDESSVKVEGWSFTGLDYRRNPYSFPEEFDGPITNNPWVGTMAISGTVTVRARVNGGAIQQKSTPITVKARNWDLEAVGAQVSKVGWAEFPPADRPPLYPENPHHLGMIRMTGEILDLTQEVVHEIRDYGPNHYLVYLKRIPAELTGKVLVHPEMETRGRFWRNQAERRPTISDQPACLRSDFDRYVRLILHHEGYPPNPQSHSGVFIAEVTRQAGSQVEDLVFSNEQYRAAADEIRARLLPIINTALVTSDNLVDKDFKVPFGCNFNFGER